MIDRAAVFGLSFWLSAIAVGVCTLGGDPEPQETVAERRFDSQGRELEPSTGLVLAEDWDLVASRCIRCHSLSQFLKQRGTRSTWQGVIDWMQATQGLEEFGDDIEERIVDYLATHYAPDAASRRAPLPAYLLPRPQR